ncbi:MAG TPA: hypothetical protein VMH81_29855 [Bryobacteraceae bacterium]|nr:hypothetical protein [Bryobacteraceae bacterium]
MPWTCQCTAMNDDAAEACIRCGRLLKQPSYDGTAWKLGAIAGALLIGGIVGLSLGVFGDKNTADASTTAQAGRKTEEKSAFQESFDTSFKASCRTSAMSAGGVTRAVADNYCDCALQSFHKNHSMTQAAAECKKYVFR